MNILQVIHGYPMLYNAGSEVYTQTLSRELSKNHKVRIFTREENPFRTDYSLRQDVDDGFPNIKIDLVNLPRTRDRYIHKAVDQAFSSILDSFTPDVVHIGHLNHLSVTLVNEAVNRFIPVLYTLHDYWLMCPRGQFMQMFPENPEHIWSSCEGQENEKCARRCYSRYFGGEPEEEKIDIEFWTSWVSRRMKHIREIVNKVDLFIAPSEYLMDRYFREFKIPKEKLRYLDYGFDRKRFEHRKKEPGEYFTFGYIGTHIPAKGIHHLIEAFGMTRNPSVLKIFGRNRDQNTSGLRKIADSMPQEIRNRIHWEKEYNNEHIVSDVFNQVDAIIVPSIWDENSPLVIHEAQAAGIPVITADKGGMKEYVNHEVNGLLFSFCSSRSLSEQMDRLSSDPGFAERLGKKGYLKSEDGKIPPIETHAEKIIELYNQIIFEKRK